MYYLLDRRSKLKIVDFNEEEKKISLSMKALLNADEETETAAEDTVEE